MDWTNFIFGLSVGVLVGALLKSLLDYILAKKKELRHKCREATIAIVDILVEWIHCSYTKEFSNEDRWRMQKTYWKNILFLDKKLLDLLHGALAYKQDAVDSQELIVQARKILLKLKKPDINANQLISWHPNIKKNI